MCSYLALSQGLAFFHTGCRSRWALRVAKHSLRGTGKNTIYKCICIYALFATYCNVLQQDKKGCWQDYSFDGVLLSTHLPHFSKLLRPENTGSAVGRLPWPGAVYRESHLNLQLSFCSKTLHKQGGVSQNVSLLEHVFKAETLRVKTCGRHNIGYTFIRAFQGQQGSLGTGLPHLHACGASASHSKQISLWALGQGADTGYSRTGFLSHHHQLKSLSNAITLPVPPAGTAQSVRVHTGPDKRCPLVEHRKKVEPTG